MLPDSSPSAILITDTKSNIYYANPAWEELTGYKLAEVRGKNPSLLQSGKTPKRVYKKMMKMLKAGKTFSTDEIRDRRKNGTEYQVHSWFYPIKRNGKNMFYVQVVNDITEYKKYQRKLEESEAKLRLILDNITGYAVYTMDKNGRITGWSKGSEMLKGYEEHEVLGKHFSIFYTEDEVKKRLPWRLLQKARKIGKVEDQGWRVKKNGKRFWADVMITAIKGPRGGVKGFVKITRDITPRKELEEQKDSFIGIASHELKTPITTVKAYSQLLTRRLAYSEDKGTQQLVEGITAQTERLTALVDDLLNVSRLDSGRFTLNKKTLSLDNLIRSVVQTFQQLTGTHPVIMEGTKPVMLSGDGPRLEQVLINLLSNAAKYSPGESKIIVHMETHKNKAIVGVRDFGQNIAKTDQAHLFERFYRTKEKEDKGISGFGLGLYIASEIIRQHEGAMWVKSRKGHGSTFYFSLPR